MARLIDADALGIGRCNPDAFPLQNRGYCAGWNGVISLIEKAPTVDAVPVVHGRWILKETCGPNTKKFHCSVCNKVPKSLCTETYCPNCGAKMDGAKDG